MYTWDIDTLEDRMMFPEETIEYTFNKKDLGVSGSRKAPKPN